MAATSINRYLAAPTTAPRSLRERVLEYAVQKRGPYPFLSPPYEREPATKHTWSADMLEWLRSQTGDAHATENFLSEACRMDWMDRAGLHMAQWSDEDMEAIYKVTKSVLYYQAEHRAAGAVYLRARNIQPEIQPYLKQVACLPFHEIPLEHWEALTKSDANPQVADILNYPEGVLSMLANGFVAPLHSSWFEQGYPPASAEGQEVCPRPPEVYEGPGDTDRAFVAVPSSWLKPQGGSTCTPLKDSLQFLKPPAWTLEQWVCLTADQKTQAIVGADASDEDLLPTRVTTGKRPRYDAARAPPSLAPHAAARPLTGNRGWPWRSPARARGRDPRSHNLNRRQPAPATPRGGWARGHGHMPADVQVRAPSLGEPRMASRPVSPVSQPHGDRHLGNLALASVPPPRPYRPAGFSSPELDLWRYAPPGNSSPLPVDAERYSAIGGRSLVPVEAERYTPVEVGSPVPVDAERHTPVREGSPPSEGSSQYDPFWDSSPVPRVLQLTLGSRGPSPRAGSPMKPLQHGSDAPTTNSLPSPAPPGYPLPHSEPIKPKQSAPPAGAYPHGTQSPLPCAFSILLGRPRAPVGPAGPGILKNLTQILEHLILIPTLEQLQRRPMQVSSPTPLRSPGPAVKPLGSPTLSELKVRNMLGIPTEGPHSAAGSPASCTVGTLGAVPPSQLLRSRDPRLMSAPLGAPKPAMKTKERLPCSEQPRLRDSLTGISAPLPSQVPRPAFPPAANPPTTSPYTPIPRPNPPPPPLSHAPRTHPPPFHPQPLTRPQWPASALTLRPHSLPLRPNPTTPILMAPGASRLLNEVAEAEKEGEKVEEEKMEEEKDAKEPLWSRTGNRATLHTSTHFAKTLGVLQGGAHGPPVWVRNTGRRRPASLRRREVTPAVWRVPPARVNADPRAQGSLPRGPWSGKQRAVHPWAVHPRAVYLWAAHPWTRLMVKLPPCCMCTWGMTKRMQTGMTKGTANGRDYEGICSCAQNEYSGCSQYGNEHRECYYQ
eukprot:jgi/Botrbrau1/16949/Bobra.49_2s0015.1